MCQSQYQAICLAKHILGKREICIASVQNQSLLYCAVELTQQSFEIKNQCLVVITQVVCTKKAIFT